MPDLVANGLPLWLLSLGHPPARRRALRAAKGHPFDIQFLGGQILEVRKKIDHF